MKIFVTTKTKPVNLDNEWINMTDTNNWHIPRKQTKLKDFLLNLLIQNVPKMAY